MSSEEEDYMSDAFLLQCGDTRPGLAPKNKQNQYEREEKEKKANKQNTILPRKQLEKHQRDVGLSTGISETSKGFALLRKMGYKPGTGIGKSGEGRVEPVSFEIKTGRSGLGKDSEMKRKSSEMNNMRAKMLEKRKKYNEKQTESFQTRMKDKFNDKLLERDLQTAQKACIQLDQQAGLTEPAEPFFWPANSLLPAGKTEEDDEDNEDSSTNRLSAGYNDHPYEEFDDDDLEEKEKEEDEEEEIEKPAYLEFSVLEITEILTRYLRNSYQYCIWCGTSYEDEQELKSMCPGNSSEAHD